MSRTIIVTGFTPPPLNEDRVLDLLGAMEWEGREQSNGYAYVSACPNPHCRGTRATGHREGCELASILATRERIS